MKKLFLLLAAGFTFASTIAQENNSVIFLPSAKMQANMLGAHPVTTMPRHNSGTNANGGLRTTGTVSTTYHDWFDYWDQNSTTSSTLYYFVTYPDSTLYDGAATTPYNVYCHGLGMSFDPSDGAYYGVQGTATANPIIDPILADTLGFTVDSFAVPFQYVQNVTPTGTDSLIIELIATAHATGTGSSATSDSGTFQLRFGASAANTAETVDSTPRFASALYTPTASGLGQNEVWDSIKAVKQRYAFPLTIADTASGIEMRFGLTTPLVVMPGRKVVSFVHYKSSSTYALGTDLTAANYLKLYAGSVAGTNWTLQTAHSSYYPSYAGSYQTGLIAQNQLRYVTDTSTNGFTYQNHSMLIPGNAFTSPDFCSATYQYFHVNYTISHSDGVANVNKTISQTNAFPVPASNSVNVMFNLSAQANVTVTLTNTVGQVVATQEANNVAGGTATFNTAALASGVYYYSVIANGERATGRIVVAH